MKKIILVILTILSACSNPKDEVIPPNINELNEKSTFVMQMKKLSPEDKQLLTQYLMLSELRHGLGGEKRPLGITVSEAIEEQKKFNASKAAEESAAAEIRKSELAKEQLRLDAIKNALKIYFVKLGKVHRVNYQQYYNLDLSISNISGKLIKGFKAEIVFLNQFGEHIKTLSIEENADWPIDVKGTFSYQFSYNQFDDETNKLLTMPQDKLKVETSITDVIF